MANLTAADLVFSEQANHNFSRVLGQLRRANLSVSNRLRSIRRDADFVREAAAAYGAFGGSSSHDDGGGEEEKKGRPLVVNERCGAWYVEPAARAASAYFKSTDGHTGQWSFSTRRLNLHLLPIIEAGDGCIIVDSTRRGKSMPDALSKTVPLWCCVLNRVLFPELSSSSATSSGEGEAEEGEGEGVGEGEGEGDPHDLYVPPGVVSASERSQMLARVPGFVEAFRRLGLLDDDDSSSKGAGGHEKKLRMQTGLLRKPLRPVWVTPETPLPFFDRQDEGEETADGRKGGDIFKSFHPVICLTSSRRDAGDGDDAGYVQGAGDDTENWARGLTPAVFWANAARLLATPEAELPALIDELVAAAAASAASCAGGGDGNGEGETITSTSATTADNPPPPPTILNKHLSIGTLHHSSSSSSPSSSSKIPPGCCIIALTPHPSKPETWAASHSSRTRTRLLLEVGLGRHKTASRALRTALPRICAFARAYLLDLDLDLDGEGGAGETSGSREDTMNEKKGGEEKEKEKGKEKKEEKEEKQKHILVTCETGRDASVGVALALLCCCFDGAGEILPPGAAPLPQLLSGTGEAKSKSEGQKKIIINKDLIRARLSRIVVTRPEANPSRATLQSVNSFLMDYS